MSGQVATTENNFCEKQNLTDPVWTEVQRFLSRRCGSAFSLWMGSLRPGADPFDPESGTAILSVATPFLRNWLTSHYSKAVLASLNDADIPARTVVFVSRSVRTAPVPQSKNLVPVGRSHSTSAKPSTGKHQYVDRCEKAGRRAPFSNKTIPEGSIDTEGTAVFINRSATDPQSFTALLNAANAVLDSPYHKEIHLETTVDKLPDQIYRLARVFISEHMKLHSCPPSRRLVLAHLYHDHYEVNGKLPYPPTSSDIINVCAGHFGVHGKEIVGQARRKEVTRARHAAMAIIRRITGRSLPTIGKRFGNRDHSTVLHAMRKIETHMATCDEFRRDLLRLEAVADMISWLRVEDWLGENQNSVPEELRHIIGIPNAPLLLSTGHACEKQDFEKETFGAKPAFPKQLDFFAA
jgi:hypothetical protein